MNLNFIEYHHTGLLLINDVCAHITEIFYILSSVMANSFATRLDKSDNSMFLTFPVKRAQLIINLLYSIVMT